MRLVVLAVLLVALAGCGSNARAPKSPFLAGGGVESGPGSGLWGDTYSGPDGNHVGCIRGRRLAELITVHNRTKKAITLLGGGGPQSSAGVIERVAVQVRLAAPPTTGDFAEIGLRGWSAHDSAAAVIPPGRDAWVQSNFLMRDCSQLAPFQPLTANRSITLRYRAGGSVTATQVVSVAAARIVLTRGPLHPKLPINQAG